MIFVGADGPVRNSHLYATDGSGRRLMHGRVANTPGELRLFFESVSEAAGPAAERSALESTTHSRAVRSLLREAAAAGDVRCTSMRIRLGDLLEPFAEVGWELGGEFLGNQADSFQVN